jgi:hypothetical protein
MDEHAGTQGQQAEFALGECLIYRWGVSWPAANAGPKGLGLGFTISTTGGFARWQDIATLSKGSSSMDMGGGGQAPPQVYGTWLSYTIALADGDKVGFAGYQPTLAPMTPPEPEPGTTWKVYIRQFAALLEDRVTSALLPKAIDTVNAGQAISFGPLTVNSAGVAKHNQLLEWSVIRGARAGRTFVAVMKGRFVLLPTFVTPVTKVPNYCLFAALVNDILARRAA